MTKLTFIFVFSGFLKNFLFILPIPFWRISCFFQPCHFIKPSIIFSCNISKITSFTKITPIVVFLRFLKYVIFLFPIANRFSVCFCQPVHFIKPSVEFCRIKSSTILSLKFCNRLIIFRFIYYILFYLPISRRLTLARSQPIHFS